MPKSEPARRPNILWITTDQQRRDTIAELGYSHMHTPNLDRLVRGGVAFTRAYCQSPICTPSRSSFMTGMYASSVHQNRNKAGYFPPEYRGEPLLVTKILADAGYDCGLIGKLDLASDHIGIEERANDGFRYFKYSSLPCSPHPEEETHDYQVWLRSLGHDPTTLLGRKAVHRHAKGRFLPPSPEDDNVPAELHQSKWCADRSIEFISEEREGPWLLCLNIFDPHPPYDPPWEYYKRFDPSSLPDPHFTESDLTSQERLNGVEYQVDARRPEARDIPQLRAAYYAMIELVDEQIGRILSYLDETGQRDETLIVFTTDHGDMLGDHGLTRKGCRFYDGLVRVPFLWSWPGHFEAGLQSDALVELTDIAPTLLEITGQNKPRRMTGISLLPILTGQASPRRHRDFVRSEYFDVQNSGFQLTAVEGPDPGRFTFGTMYRDERWKLVVYHTHSMGELFDMENDPNEFENLWDHPARQALKAELIKASFDAAVLGGDIGPPLKLRT